MINVVLIFLCAFIMFKIAQRKFALDPGSIHIYVLAFANASVLLLHETWYFQFINGHQWLLWSKEGMVGKVLAVNATYVLVFTLCYLILIKLFKIDQHVNKLNKFHYPLNNFIIIYFSTLFISIILDLLSLNYFDAYWSQITQLAFLISAAVLVSKIKNDYILFATCLLYMAFVIFISSPLLSSSESYVINRGGAVATILFVVVFIDVTQQRNLLSKIRVNLGLLFLPILLGASNFIEAYINGSQDSFYQLVIYMLEGYEVRMMENQAIIINTIETNRMYGLGNTYLFAFIDLIFPFQNFNLSPAVWLSSYLTNGADVKAQFGFSTIAEGMMNFPVYGAVVAALINAFILFLLRNLLHKNRYYGPILFAALFVLPYYLYRMDFNYVLKKAEFAILSTIAVLILLKIIGLLNLPTKRS